MGDDPPLLPTMTVPEGFGPPNSRGPFTLHNGPSYRATADGDVRSGMVVLDRHCNGMGFLHGGMASAFADSAVAWAVWNHTERLSVTLKLTMTFLDIVKVGTWLEARPVVDRALDDVVHAHTELIAMTGGGEETVAARADAVFRLLRRGTSRLIRNTGSRQ